MKIKLFTAIIMLSFATFAPSKSDAKTIKLFNGKNLDNWKAYVDKNQIKPEELFFVKNGVINCIGNPLGYLYTQETYRNFKLHVEWRWPSEATNSGIFLFVQEPSSTFPNAIECQLKAGDAGDFVLLNGSDLNEFVRKPGEKRPSFPVVQKKKASNEKKIGKWNTADITCKDGSITVYINEELQNEGTGSLHKSGHIALQSEGKDVQFRNIKLTPLK